MASRFMAMNEEASAPVVKPRALVVIADGSDELETLVLSDILTRGDMHVSTACVGLKKGNLVDGNFGLKIKAEHAFEDCSYRNYELIVLPGGLGVNRLRDCDLLVKMLAKQRDSGQWIAAISGAPAVVLKPHGLLAARATCDQAHERLMPNEYVDEDVVVDDHCVTSRGPGTAMAFALKLVDLLCGHQEAARVAAEVCHPLP
ncbi:hypothetical protein PybrP1_010793 [[Pythium] brassicae (nom. inval.)]|nr:hypothetical protein PybrP1_010793 [[Pythium] brassicae (nom. inval.)]